MFVGYYLVQIENPCDDGIKTRKTIFLTICIIKYYRFHFYLKIYNNLAQKNKKASELQPKLYIVYLISYDLSPKYKLFESRFAETQYYRRLLFAFLTATICNLLKCYLRERLENILFRSLPKL